MRLHTSATRNWILLLGALALAACEGSVAVPVVATGDAQTVVTGSFVQLDASGSSDPQGRLLTFHWSFIGRPLGSQTQLIDPGSAKTSFVADMAGEYMLNVTVSNSVRQNEATVKVTAAACTKPVLSPPTFKVGGATVATAFKGDRVDLAVAVSAFGNCSQTLNYSWQLTPRAGSSAAISLQGFATASFIADTFGGSFDVSVTATDRLGNTSNAVSLTIPVSPCGGGQPTVDFGVSSVAGAFDPRTLTASGVSNPDDSACPAKYGQKPYTLTWSVISPPNARYTLDASSVAEGTAVTFTPQQNAIFVLQLVATGSKGAVSTPVTKDIVASCPVPFTVGAPDIAGVTPESGDTFPRGTPGSFSFFSGDRVTVGATVASSAACRSTSDTFSYRWTLLERPAGSNAVLNSATLAQPTFVPDVPGGTYKLQVEVTDSIGNTRTSAVRAITAGTCGRNPILVSATDTTAGSPRPFDPRTLKASPSSDDDDATKCPARFAQTYTFAWSSSGGSFSAASAAQTSFTPGGSASYGVQVLVKGSNGQSATATVGVDARCAAPFISSPAVGVDFSGSQAVGSAPPRSLAGGSFNVYRDDAVKVSTTAASNCFSPANAGLTYEWTLTGANGSVTRVTTASASFTIDQPNGSYAASVVVKDALGNASTAQGASFRAASCGATPIFAQIGDTPGARPFDDHTFIAGFAVGRTTFSDDDVGTICPAGFANQYTFDWRVASSTPDVGFIFNTTRGASVTFSPGGNAVYNIRLAIAGGPRRAEFFQLVMVSCSDLVPKAGAISVLGSTPGYNAGPFAGRFFRDDTVVLSTAAPTSLCFSSTQAASYLWSLRRPLSSTDVAFNTTSPNPTFVADVSAGLWEVTLIVVDKLGNRSQPLTAAFTAEPCGINPVAVSLAGPTRPSGSLPFDPYMITASAHSNDDDLAHCPARFAQTYSLAFSLTSNPAKPLSVLAPASAVGVLPGAPATSTLKPGGNATYTVAVHASGSKSGNFADASQGVIVDCTDPMPTKVTSPSIALVMPPGGGDGFTRAAGQFFRDDTLTLTATGSSVCFSPGNTSFAYAWTLSPVNPPALNGATTQTPWFIVNTPGGAYSLSVTATDSIGNAQTGQRTFTADSCGTNPVRATIGALQAPGAKPMDDWTLTAVSTSGPQFSDDSDLSKCPARFAPTYTFAWSLNPPSGAFSSAFSNPTTFTPGDHRPYSVHLVVTGNGQTGVADHSIDASCAAPSVGTPAVALVNGALPSSTIYVGDVVQVATSVTSNCFASASSLHYTYTLQRSGPPPLELFVPSANAAQPSFQPQILGGSYQVSVTVSDGSGQSTSPATALFINVSTCGSATPTAQFVATQHFDGIVQRLPSGVIDTTAPLDIRQSITQSPLDLTPIATIEGHSFAVPFYLDRSIGIDVTISSSDCTSVQFTGARLFDPTFALVPLDRFTQPTPTPITVANGGHLQFAFTPRLGDADAQHPGYYFLSMDILSGGSIQPQTFIVQPTQINVGGRCGLNAPFVDAVFQPLSPQRAGTAVTGTSLATDKDNDTLKFFPVTPDPGTSGGCGLNQTLSYAWSFASNPTASVATLAPPDATVTHFTPDLAGDYSVRLVVGDGTTSGAAGDGKSTQTFVYTASP